MDINLFREEKEAEKIRESQKKRFPIDSKSSEEYILKSKQMVGLVDDVINLDTEWRKRNI